MVEVLDRVRVAPGEQQIAADEVRREVIGRVAVGPRLQERRSGVPRGRPLREDELIEVIWNPGAPAQREVGQAANKAATRQQTLLRLCAEASAQDAEPTVGDLAEALGVTPRTVDRDIAALRAAGETLMTRGGGG